MSARVYLTWDEVRAATERLARRVRQSGPDPRRIIAVARGGFAPAALLAHHLGVRRVESVQICSYDDGHHHMEYPVTYQGLVPLDEPDTLVVDDIFDTGATHRMLLQLYPRASHLALISHVADFRGEIDIPKGTWVVFPWEVD